jgi:hypothetical protein
MLECPSWNCAKHRAVFTPTNSDRGDWSGCWEVQEVFSDFVDEVTYLSEEDEISFSTINGKVNKITYAPAATDARLVCPHCPASRRPSTPELTHWFDRYGKVPFEKEKQHLDVFAEELRRSGANSSRYIVAYTPLGAKKERALLRLQRAKEYLISTYKFRRDLIKTSVAGNREKLTFELYIDVEGERQE